MKFLSTRGNSPGLSASDAMEVGLAPDGGLYVPESFRPIELSDFDTATNYADFASRMLAPFFLGDVLEKPLREICEQAFSFDIPLKDLPHETSVLELFHGPTAAFKDIGARFLAECLSRISTEPQTILVATSGDTGGAVAAAFYERPGFEVVILFPKDGVSERQRKQLTCWGKNIKAFAVNGSFDDCQKLVKSAFADTELRARIKISSANSINVGRLLPQATYYARASIQYFFRHQKPATFIIPSGNLGNATAALWAKRMGFPIDHIGIATNANGVVPLYFQTGHWTPGSSVSTLANAMDVGNPSNMERVLKFEAQNLKKIVFSESIGDEVIRETIRKGEAKYGEIWCPHTATAVALRERHLKMSNAVVVATAHPAKFDTIVEPLIGHSVIVPPSLAKLFDLPSSSVEIGTDYLAFRQKIEG